MTFVKGRHSEAPEYKSLNPCTTDLEIVHLQKKFGAIVKEYSSPRLVLLNDEKLAVFCHDGLHDLMSTSTVSLHVLEQHFGNVDKWSIQSYHSFWKDKLKDAPDVMLGYEKSERHFVTFEESKQLSLLDGDRAFYPDINDDPQPIEMKVFCTGSSHPNMVIYVYVKWKEPRTNDIVHTSMLDLKYITALPTFNKMLLDVLMQGCEPLRPIKNLIMGSQYKQKVDDWSLSTSNTEEPSPNWIYTPYYFKGKEYYFEERYKVNPKANLTVYGDDLHDDKFRGVFLVHSPVFNYPRLTDMVWLADQNALTAVKEAAKEAPTSGKKRGRPPSSQSAGGGGGKLHAPELDEFSGGYQHTLKHEEEWKNYWNKVS